jgi:hypothetical protein
MTTGEGAPVFVAGSAGRSAGIEGSALGSGEGSLTAFED